MTLARVRSIWDSLLSRSAASGGGRVGASPAWLVGRRPRGLTEQDYNQSLESWTRERR